MIIKSKIKLQVYETSVEIMVVDTMEELYQMLCKKGILASDILDCEGVTMGVGKTYMVALVKDRLTHNLIAHELFHLAKMVTNDIDIEDEESQAWLNGHVTEHVYKILNKKNIQVKL